MHWMQWPALITWLTLILMIWTSMLVGRARQRYGVRAPATTGNEHFERAFRVQMNTLENVVLFLPALWLAARLWDPAWASVCGAAWVAGRVWYGLAYVRDPGARAGGFTLSMIACAVLVLAVGVAWARTLIAA